MFFQILNILVIKIIYYQAKNTINLIKYFLINYNFTFYHNLIIIKKINLKLYNFILKFINEFFYLLYNKNRLL